MGKEEWKGERLYEQRFFYRVYFETSAVVQYGIEEILDTLQRAQVNKIMFIAHDPWGSEFQFHDEYYRFTRLRPQRSEFSIQHGVEDMLGQVCEAAAKRGMQVYAHDLAYECATPDYWPAEGGSDISRRILRNFTACSQIDIFGRKNFRVCTNNPDYIQFYLSLIEDQLRNYPIEGIKINFERNGPLSSVLVGNYPATFHYRKPLAPVCFCPHCLAKARERGINIERAKEGWMELLRFSEKSWEAARRKGDSFAGGQGTLTSPTDTTPPPDGYFITFLRILMKYPEILQWNQMWYDSLQSLYAQIYGVVKMISPERKLGIHVWHHRDFSIFERAMYDYGEMKRYADWIKPKTDPTCAGFRFHQDVRRYAQALFSDQELRRAYECWCTLLGWNFEAEYEELPEKGMSMEYLRRNVQTAVQAVNHEVPIYPGVGIDMPSPAKAYTPEIIRESLITAYQAGASGVLLCRNYLEMKKENILAAGKAIEEIKRDIAARKQPSL